MLANCRALNRSLSSVTWTSVGETTTAAPSAKPLRDAVSNRDRSEIVLQNIGELEKEEDLPQTDIAALDRMRRLAAKPRDVLSDIHTHAAAACRRLYRQRNLVLHAGRTDAVALRASLRTAAPLVGAGFDRIVHAHYVDGLKPLEIAARARIALATVNTLGGPSCIDLLA